jgi:hypothetical protein
VSLGDYLLEIACSATRFPLPWYLLASRTSMGTKRLAEKTLGMHAICKPIG